MPFDDAEREARAARDATQDWINDYLLRRLGDLEERDGEPGSVGPVPRHRWLNEDGEHRLQFEQGPKPGKWGEPSEDLTGPRGYPGRVVGGGGGTSFTPPATTMPSDGTVPTFIAPGEVFVVPLHRQALFAQNVDCEGFIDLSGALIEVN